MPIDKDEARLIAETVIEHLKAAGLKVTTEAEDAPKQKATKATKAADKPAPAPEAAAPPAKADKAPAAVDRNAVHAALKSYSEKHGKDGALAILHKYSPTLSGLTDDQFEKVIADLSQPPAAASDFD